METIIELCGKTFKLTIEEVTSEPTETATATGRVYYAGGENQGIAEAGVHFTQNDGATYTTETDADGNYSIEVPPGDYEVIIDMPDKYLGKGSMAVNSTDAGMASAWGVNPYMIPMIQFMAGDVKEHVGHIGSNDAGAIMYYFLTKDVEIFDVDEYVHCWEWLSTDTNGDVAVDQANDISLSAGVHEGLNIAVRAAGDFNGSGVYPDAI